MKKKLLLTVSLVLALLFAVIATLAVSANAHTWYQGSPKVLRGKWRKKIAPKRYVAFSFHKNAIYNQGMAAYERVFFPRYRKISRNVYAIRGRVFNNAPAGGILMTYKFKIINSHRFYVKGGDAWKGYYNKF